MKINFIFKLKESLSPKKLKVWLMKINFTSNSKCHSHSKKLKVWSMKVNFTLKLKVSFSPQKTQSVIDEN